MSSNVIHIPIRDLGESRSPSVSTPISGLKLSALQRAHAKLVADISNLSLEPALDLPAEPWADEVRSVNALLLGLVNAVDPFISAIGRELRNGSPVGIDLTVFVGQLLGALDGNATGEVERVAEAVEQLSANDPWEAA